LNEGPLSAVAAGLFQLNSTLTAWRFPMPTPSLDDKKAYCAKTRRSNYAASLRLEGFESSPLDAERRLPSREELLKTYRQKQA